MPISGGVIRLETTTVDLSVSHADTSARATVPEFDRCFIPAGDCLVDGVFEQILQSDGSSLPSFMTYTASESAVQTINLAPTSLSDVGTWNMKATYNPQRTGAATTEIQWIIEVFEACSDSFDIENDDGSPYEVKSTLHFDSTVQSYDFFLGNYIMSPSTHSSCGTTTSVAAASGSTNGILTITKSDQLVQSQNIAITATTDLGVIVHEYII